MTYHKPVLVREVLQALSLKPGGHYLDVTFGGGGHTRAILEAEPTCHVTSLDWDKVAIETNAGPIKETFGDRFTMVWGNMAHLYKIIKKERLPKFDGILADFGTSQFQIHEKDGFSFRKDTPLDMRMSTSHQHKTAAIIVNEYSEKDLADLFWYYGEEQASRKIARLIVEARKIKPLKTTADLVAVIEQVYNPVIFRAKRGIHPATKVFQALRIEVNDELNNIKSFLAAATPQLNPGGRLVCISFHSLEDGLVKDYFQEHQMELQMLSKRPITAQEDELAENASSRSAKLRVAERI